MRAPAALAKKDGHAPFQLGQLVLIAKKLALISIAMMRPLPSPPRLSYHDSQAAISKMHDPATRAFLAKSNEEYWSWDEMRHRPLPPGLSAAEAWALVEYRRVSNRRPLPLLDAGGAAFCYWTPDKAQRTLHTIDRQGAAPAEFHGNTSDSIAAMRDRILIESLMEEAIASSQIEGAVTTRAIAMEMLRSGRKPKDRSEQMIANGYATILLLKERLDRPLSIELLNEIQSSMTQGTLDNPDDAGRLRSPEDNVRIVDSRDNEVVFVPPSADQLPDRLQKLVDFANADPGSESFIHPLVRAAILHFWVAYEHPYVDGNGRTARAIFYWAMLKANYWLFEFLTISRIIHAAPMRYYTSFLYSEHYSNDLTYFLMFQFDVTRRALDDLGKRINEIRTQQDKLNEIKIAERLNARQRALLNHALRHPTQIYTFESHRRSHGISHQTARTDIIGLCEKGVLVETGSQRPREFTAAPNLIARVRSGAKPPGKK